ncbi:MAG TPA: sialate O-acetylesterase [Arachidicoccus sp.]|nr:sialate O-acetylesterase [Arachidicoccus sp.]
MLKRTKIVENGLAGLRLWAGIGLALFILLISGTGSYGAVVLPSVIGNNMVLQRSAKVALWGKAKPNVRVVIITSWNKKRYTVQAGRDSTWKALVQTPRAGGPYEVSFNDGQLTTLHNILIGEVWVCSGQSNMEMPMQGFYNQPVLHSNDIIMAAANPEIRLIRYERALSRTPKFDCPSTGWVVSDGPSAKLFSAVGYQFAQMLQEKLKVPVGMIMSTWGGTMIEGWMPTESFSAFPEIKVRPASASDTTAMIKNEPSVLFNAMIQPFVGYGIKGVLWYQGEQNRVNPQIYDRLLTSMVSDWRALWKAGSWPFYYVQIAPYKYVDKLGPANLLREAQLKASHMIPNAGMVVSMDVGAKHFIHPPNKTLISKRLLYWALANDYGFKGIAYASPEFKSMQVDKETAHISFTHSPKGLSSFGQELTAFEMAGADHKFYPAAAKITGKGVDVHCDKVPEPVAVRYGFKDWAEGHLFSSEGLPVGPFRTDEWQNAEK